MLVTSSRSCWQVCCIFCLSPSKMGSWWLTSAALLLIIFLIDVEKREDIFPLLVATVWHQQRRKRTLTVFNHGMETLLSLTVFVDSDCSNLTFLMTPTPSFFHSQDTFTGFFLFCFFGILKTRNYFSKTRGEFTAPHRCKCYKRAYWKSWQFRSHCTCANTGSGKVKKTKQNKEWRLTCT